MFSKTKRTWFYLFFALYFVFSILGATERSILIQPAQASEYYSSAIEHDKIDLQLTEKLQITDAIVKVYKHIKKEEATLVVDNVYKYSEAYSLQPSLIIGLIATESSFKRRAVSKEGASGYTQVLAKHHGKKIKGRNVFRTEVNIEVGIQILSECMVKYEGNERRALGCYNGTSDAKKIAKFQNTINKRKNQLLQAASIQIASL